MNATEQYAADRFHRDVKKIPDYDWLNEIYSGFCSLEMGDETRGDKKVDLVPPNSLSPLHNTTHNTQIRTYQISRLQ